MRSSDADPVRLGAAAAARAVHEGRLGATALVDACLARIARLEPRVRAWVHVDEAGARTAARDLDAEARAGRFRGPLHGVPVGVKDIIHVAGMTTTAGSKPSAHVRPTADATAVGRLRAAGAIVLGKTATTEFAYLDPAPTTNPWNAAHTPGGSSAGSGAAVGGGMVPLALGTQTVGSVLRPAAYCGAVGFKATHGLVPADGVIPLAWSLDHVGVLGRSVADAALALSVLAARPFDALPRSSAPRLALVPELLARATPEVAAQVSAAAERFARAGATVVEVKLPGSFAELHAVGRAVLEAEAAAYHEPRYRANAGDFGRAIGALIEDGLRRTAISYVVANRARLAFRDDVMPLLDAHDALLSPTAPSPAPRGLGSTGDPWFCAPWSFAGVPAITLPSGVSADGLPHAIQLVQAAAGEGRLLAVAAWCERVLGFDGVPPE